jgi:GT2 family glycosyltransferase
VFTDDDCILSRLYLSDLLAHYGKDSRIAIRGGRVELGDAGDYPLTIKLEDVAARLTYSTHPGGFVQGCNMTMNREVINLIGLFDERFGAGAPFKSAEDSDYLYRAHLSHIPVEYVPDMAVFHFHGRNSKRSAKRLQFGYNFGNGALYAKFMFRAPKLLKHLYWDAKKAIKEIFGGPVFNPDVGLTYRAIVMGNICGMLGYGLSIVRGGVRGRRL